MPVLSSKPETNRERFHPTIKDDAMNDLEQRIHQLADPLQLLSFATVNEEGKPRVRYVVGKADKDLAIRFSTHLDSNKVGQMGANPAVHVTLGATDFSAPQWLQIDGTAEVSTTEAERRAFWFDGLRAHFSGIDDPRYCVVIIRPSRIELVSTNKPLPEVWQPEPRLQ
jgi:general stress protein 26